MAEFRIFAGESNLSVIVRNVGPRSLLAAQPHGDGLRRVSLAVLEDIQARPHGGPSDYLPFRPDNAQDQLPIAACRLFSLRIVIGRAPQQHCTMAQDQHQRGLLPIHDCGSPYGQANNDNWHTTPVPMRPVGTPEKPVSSAGSTGPSSFAQVPDGRATVSRLPIPTKRG